VTEQTITTVKHELEPCRVQLDIEVPAEKVDDVYDEIVKQYKAEANLPGFRPGKAPKSLVESRFSNEIQNQAIRRLVSDALMTGMEQENLSMETRPEIADEENLQIEKGTSFCFSVSFDTSPEFETPEYKGLKIDKAKEEVTSQEIEEFLNDWLKQRAEYEKVDRPAQEGDVIKVSYRGELTDGSETSEDLPESAKYLLSGDDTWLALQEPELLPGCTENLKGAQAGEEKQFEVTFPEDYPEEALRGKTVSYNVSVSEIHASRTPELTDELAQEIGAQDAETLRENVRQHMQQNKDVQYDREIREELVGKLLDGMEFALPPRILAAETHDTMTELTRREQSQGTSEEELKEKREELYEEAKRSAEAKLRRSYVLQRIAELEDISVSEEELKGTIQTLSQRENMSPDELRKRLEENGRIQDVRNQLREMKTVERILEYVEDDSEESGDDSQEEEPASNEQPEESDKQEEVSHG